MPVSGKAIHYDKRHLFRFGGEEKHFLPGTTRTTYELNGFRICPMVCYDLRFPVWSRNQEDYDVLIYVGNWPRARQYAWDTLLRARAIENLSYVIGVNRVGPDGNGVPHGGGSVVVDYAGADVLNLGDTVCCCTAVLDRDALVAFRERFGFQQDADSFTLG
jgi:predicted amidohydrolase